MGRCEREGEGWIGKRQVRKERIMERKREAWKGKGKLGKKKGEVWNANGKVG